MSVENTLSGETSTHPREVWTIVSGDQRLAFALVYKREVRSAELTLERVKISFSKRSESIGLEYYPDKSNARLYPYAANGEERPARIGELGILADQMKPLVDQVNDPKYLTIFREVLIALKTVPFLEPGHR